MTMERNKFRCFSSPPDFPSSSPPLCAATIPDVGSGDEELWLPTSTRSAEDNASSPRNPSTCSRSFSSPAPCADSGVFYSSASPLTFSSCTTASTFQRPSDVIAKVNATFFSPSRSCPPSAVFSQASHVLPSQCVQPSHARRSLDVSGRESQLSRICSAHIAEYYSADEDVDMQINYPEPKLGARHAFPLLDTNISQGAHSDAINSDSTDSAHLTVCHFAETTLAPLAAHSTTPARRYRATKISRESETALVIGVRGRPAPTAVPLCTHEIAEQQRRTDYTQNRDRGQEMQLPQLSEEQQRQQREGEHGQPRPTVKHCQQREKHHEEEQLNQHCQEEVNSPMQGNDQSDQEPRLSDGLRQRRQQQRRDESQRFQEEHLQKFYHRNTLSGLIRKLSARKQHLLTPSPFPPERTAQIQLLQERLRIFWKDFSNQAPPQSDDSATKNLSLLRSTTKKACGNDFLYKETSILRRSSYTGSFFSAATSSRSRYVVTPVCAACETSVPVQASHTRGMQEQHEPQEEMQKRTKELRRKEKTLSKWWHPVTWVILGCDIIIVGSTCILHAMNPASLIDKVLLTHVSFSASLCALSGGTLPGTAECLASAASGNAAAAAASTLAAANATKWESDLLSREEEQQQAELPLLQLLRDPYFLPHYKRYLPHPLKRELGLACVCGWAALVVLAVLTLWMTGHDRSLAVRVFPAIPTSNSESEPACSVNEKEDGGPVAHDSKSVADTNRERDEACTTSCSNSSRVSSRRGSPARERYNSASTCVRNITSPCFCSTAGFSSSCRASGTIGSANSQSVTSACVCHNDSRRFPTDVSRRGTRSVDHHAHCCRGREPANRKPYREAAVNITAGGEYDNGRSYRSGIERTCAAEMEARLHDYEVTVLKEYQAGAATYTRARMRCVSLFVFFIFFAMNFIVQLYARCHRTKYQFYTLQSLAAAALDEEAHLAKTTDSGERNDNKAGGARRDLPTTPNTPLPPLKLLLHAQQPAAASSAYHFGKGDAEENTRRYHPPSGDDHGGEFAGLQLGYEGQRDNKQEPPRSPSYVYYRDYLFWYQLFADFCRDLEIRLSLAWTLLHIIPVISCRRVMREAEEHVNAAHNTFRRRYRHVSSARHSV